MELFTQLFGGLLLFVFHCLDRIVINGYVSGLSRPEQVVHFFRRVLGVPILSKEVLSQREFEQAQQRRDESFLAQHLRHVTVVDHQDGVFAGTNELVEKIGGKPPTTLEQFIQENREAFSRVD